MKYHTSYIILILTSILFSCTTHEEGMPLQACTNGSFATLGTVVNTTRITVDSDTYGTLLPVNTSLFSAKGADILGQRVLLEFLFLADRQDTILKTKEIEIINLYKVPTKDISLIMSDETNEEIDGTFGTAPILVTSSNISKEHLNIQYEIEGENEDITHCVSLLVRKEAQPDKEGLLPVELRHDPKGDLQVNSFWGVVSFTLSGIPQCQSSDFKGFRILYKNKTGDNAYAIVTPK